MPIEDADRVHSKHEESTVLTIFGYKISFMMLMIIIGVSIGAIFLLIAGYMMMTPQPVIDIINTTPTPSPDNTNIEFTLITTDYNYNIIQMTYIKNKPITILQNELLLSLYPPQSTHYVQRQAINNNNNVTYFNNQSNIVYIYTGLDNIFHMSYNLPKYSDCADFINGNWILNIDDNTTQQNMYKFKFNITNSKTIIIENNMSINNFINNASDYSTLFIYSGDYKEKLELTRPLRLIGFGNPSLDAGGSGADITIRSNNNVISGLTIMNSGIKEFIDGGIVIFPGSNENIITKNTIYKTIYGIRLDQSDTNTITNNTIYDNDKNGIMVIGSSSNTIIKNTIYTNINGIYLDSKSNLNHIRENNIYNNKDYGIIIEDYASLQNICEYNTYNNNKMSCSDSIDRNQTSISITITTSNTPRPIITSNNWWADCNGNPKCYQSG